MDNCRGPVSFEHGIEASAIANVAALERTPLDEFSVAVAEIVEDDWCEAIIGKTEARMGTNIAGAANDEYVCHQISSRRRRFSCSGKNAFDAELPVHLIEIGAKTRNRASFGSTQFNWVVVERFPKKPNKRQLHYVPESAA